MGKRGQKPLEERLGVERFRTMLKFLHPRQISMLICSHFTTDEERANCEACRRAIYRAKKRTEESEMTEVMISSQEIEELRYGDIRIWLPKDNVDAVKKAMRLLEFHIKELESRSKDRIH